MPPTFHDFFHKNLNKQQQKAVNQKNGVVLVIAGAGSGKTRVITARIINLIMNEHVHPTAIVALTFTNKAAKEMLDRVKSFVGKLPFMPFIGTFHSYCLYLLKRNAKLLDHETFSIMDSDDQQKLLHQLIKRYHLGKQATSKQVAYHISKFKNSLHHKTEDLDTYTEPLIKQLHTAYEQEKNLSKCLDFDDLLLETLKLFRKNKNFKRDHQKFIRHVLVDEYQDTNAVQHELLKHMTLQGKKKFTIDSLCVVGDEDQSIYSWRGATVANIMNFKKDFPTVKTIKIEQNYRSVQPILDTANAVIQHNQHRNPKNLWSEKKGVNRIKSLLCVSGYQEAEAVALFAKTVHRAQQLSSTAVLYRAHHQSRIIEEALLRHAVPYRIIGGIQFYERAEIKDILAFLRIIVNPFDRISVSRVINTPSRGLGEKFQDLLLSRWNEEPFLTIHDLCKKLRSDASVTKTKQESLKQFLSFFDDLQATNKPTSVIENIIKRTDYLNYLKNSHEPPVARDKGNNIKELLQAVQYFEKQGTTTLTAFLDEVALLQDKIHDKEQQDDHIKLMTMHAVKGLEFDNIIITGLEEGVLPSSHSLLETKTIEEECRLFYVGITRAKERLLLTRARYRHTFGSMEYQTSSRFFDELPKTLVPDADISYTNEHYIESLFAQWLKISLPCPERTHIFTFGSAKPAYASTKKQIFLSQKTTGKWRKHRPVKHQKFGIGIIKNIEQKGSNKTYITAKFKSGIKKIDAQYLSRL